MPRVSVLIPNFNHARYLRARIGSVLNQTYRDIEIIFLDDASSDGSMAVFAEFAGDSRMRAIVNDVNSGGPFHQWNRGVAEARGEYVWIAESDDYADPRLLERLVGALETHPSCGLAFCESYYVEGDQPTAGRTNDSHLPANARWREDWIADGRAVMAEHLVRWCCIPNASAVVFRRSLYHAVGGPDAGMRLCGDWMFWARLMAVSDVAHVGEPLNYFRCHNATVRTRYRRSGDSISENYRVVEFITRHATVQSEILESVLASRAERFLAASIEPRFTLKDAWKVYRAARRVDPIAWRRLGLAWLRWQAGALRRRFLASIRPAPDTAGPVRP